MARWRRPGADEILLVYVLLAVIGSIWSWLSHTASPPVYGRTRPTPNAGEELGATVPRPPAWLLPCGLLAGALLTLAFLASMDWIPVLGCRPAASSACIALAEGYPLRWLTTYQNMPLIYKGALLKDFAQWALVSTSVTDTTSQPQVTPRINTDLVG